MTFSIRLLALPVAALLLVETGCGGSLTESPGDPELTESRSGLTKGSGGSNGDQDYCAGALRCSAGEGDCDTDLECIPGLVCGTDNGPRFGMSATHDVCWPATCTDGIQDGDETGIDVGGSCGTLPTCTKPNGEADTCSTMCPCSVGWGDCDNDSECRSGLVCGTDNGPRFGMAATTDVCWPRTCTDGIQNGDETGIDSGGSCGTAPVCPKPNGQTDTCSTVCRCASGWGDCDSDQECQSGLVCGTDNGARFGMAATTDVCVPQHCMNGVKDRDETGIDTGGSCGTPPACTQPNGLSDTCNATCPCAAGWGDCDTDAECQSGLVCGTDNGAKFGMPASTDVCVPQHCTNQLRDADEVGVDCGGTTCGTCEISRTASTVTVSPASVPADGTTAATVTVTVEDALGRPIANQAVVLAYSGTASITPASTTSDANGVATFQVTASAATTGSVTATVNPGGGEMVLTSSAALAFLSVCGNGVLEPGEQCDDGSLDNLDGCDATCRFEQVQRVNWLKMQFATDAFCTSNALGGALVDSSTQASLQAEIDPAIADGSINNVWKILYLDDLTGTNDSQIGLGVVGGTPMIPGATAYDGTSDLDWWYTSDSSLLDGNRNPSVSLGGSITSNVLAAGNGRLPFVLLPGHVFSLSNAHITSTIGAASAPLISNGLPPGHLASEHLDPMLVSFATMGDKSDVGAGRLCASIAAADLVRVAIPQSITSYCTAYTVANSMLDLIVGGCKIGFLQVIKPTQPDTVDPDAPAAGAGPPYTLSASGGTAIDTCRDKDRKRVPLDSCLASAAYSGYLKFATERVIAR